MSFRVRKGDAVVANWHYSSNETRRRARWSLGIAVNYFSPMQNNFSRRSPLAFSAARM